MIGSRVSAFMSLLGKIDSDPTLLGANHFKPIDTDVSIIPFFQRSLNFNKHLLKPERPLTTKSKLNGPRLHKGREILDMN